MKPRNILKHDVEGALREKLRLRMSLHTKLLMSEFDVSRGVIDRLMRELKRAGRVKVTIGGGGS